MIARLAGPRRGVVCCLPLLLFVLSAPWALHASPPLPIGPEIRVNAGTVGLHFIPKVAVFQDGAFVVVWTVGNAPIYPYPPDCGSGLYLPPFHPGGRTVLHARFFHADGSPASGEFRLVPPAGSQQVDSVAALADGSFVVAWKQVNGSGRSVVMAARFARDATPIVAPFRVHAASPFSRVCGQVAVAPDSRSFAVAWSAADFDPPYDDYGHFDTYARRFTAAGAPLGPEVLVAQGSSGSTAGGGAGADVVGSGIALAGDGSLLVALSYFGDGRYVWVAKVDATGSLVRSIPTEQTLAGTYASMILSSDGVLALVWIDDAYCGVSSWAQRFSTDGTPLDSAPFRISSLGACDGPMIAASPGGGFVAAWTNLAADGDGFGAFGAVMGADGTAQALDFRINVTTAGEQILTGLAGNARGDLVAVWYQTPSEVNAYVKGSEIFARRLSRGPPVR